MYSFCPHCGNSTDQDQVPGRMLTCIHCKREIGLIPADRPPVDEADERILAKTAGRCPVCQQLVELRPADTAKKFVPHYGAAPSRKMCPGSGKLLF